MNIMQDKLSATPCSLRRLSGISGLPIGAAVDMPTLAGDDARYRETLAREFRACVAENAFKPSEVWIGPRDYDFTVTDRLAAFAGENGMLLRGHTLVWHQQTPHWLGNNPHAVPAGELRGLLRDYIHAIVGRYRGQVAHWDVVNEAISDPGDDGEHGEHGTAPRLRDESIWQRALGPEYLSLAFRWAHEADPDARLYYNDYEIEDLGPKSDAVYALLKNLLADGVPVHGIGFQGHLVNGWRATDDHRANIRRFVDLGLEWAVTEADIRMPLHGGAPTSEQLALQADGYEDLARLCRTEPNCRSLIFWGFTDAHSWIPGFRKGWGASLPFDDEYRPKPAYGAIQSALG